MPQYNLNAKIRSGHEPLLLLGVVHVETWREAIAIARTKLLELGHSPADYYLRAWLFKPSKKPKYQPRRRKFDDD
jgi:hypothetical protein